MNYQFTKQDSNRLRKLEDALTALKDRTEAYFSITKITSIKGLCKNPDVNKQYCVYLSSLVLKEPGKLPIQYSKKSIKQIIKDVADNPRKTKQAEDLRYAIRCCQSETRRVGWNTVRIIENKNVLILEYILQSLLSSKDVAPMYAYDATRKYVETYDGRFGTGLIVNSIPMFEKVLKFWRTLERSKLPMICDVSVKK